jgi:signal peptidase II
MERKKHILIVIITFAINVALDQITKLVAVLYIKGNEPLYLLKKTIMIAYTENSGAFLSMGSNWPVIVKYAVLVIIPIIVCLYGIYYCIVKEKNITKVILLVTIIGGGLSNLIDRFINDFKVVDFLNFGIGSLRTGILNVADLSVTFGAILFMIYEFRQKKTEIVDKAN